MAYEIDRYDGSVFTSIPDQTVDSTSCDLKLIGKNYAGYGKYENENFLALLENFRGDVQPRKPIIGQLWFDSSTNKIKFKDINAQWRSLTVTEININAPTSLTARDKGTLWFDDTHKQMNVWDGTQFVEIGPEIAYGHGQTRLRSGVIRDNGNVEHSIIRIYNENQVIGTISADEYNIGTIENIPGFTRIKKGITLVNTPADGVTTDEHYFWGTASNTLKFGGKTLSDFVLRTGSGSTFDDAGFAVGNDADLKIYVDETNKPVIENSLGNTIRFRIKTGATNNDVMVLSSVGVLPNDSNSYDLGSGSRQWREIHAVDMFSNTVTATTIVGNVDGTVTGNVTGDVTGSVLGNLKYSPTGIAYNATTQTFNGLVGNITVMNVDSVNVVDKIYGDLKGDLYHYDGAIAYNNATKTFSGNLVGNASTASTLFEPKFINSVPFDGSSNITIFDDTKLAVNGGTMNGFITLHADPTDRYHAATKGYVDDQIQSRDLFFSLDTRGLSTTASGPGSVAALLNEIAPTTQFRPGTKVHIASTIQNVLSIGSLTYGRWISATYINGVSITTTMENPTRQNTLLYRVNSSGTSWEYVSG